MYRGRLFLEDRGLRRLAAQLGQLALEPDAGEARPQTAAKGLLRNVVIPYGVAQDFADLFLGATPVPPGAASQARLHVVFSNVASGR
jgi:hypothetical protein